MALTSFEGWDLDDVRRFEASYTRGSQEECWIWTGPVGRNYPTFSCKTQAVTPNQLIYNMVIGLPKLRHRLMHNCGNKMCVNPYHKKLVRLRRKNPDRKIPYARKKSRRPKKTVCKNGHDLTKPNARVSSGEGRDECRECKRERSLRAYRANREEYNRRQKVRQQQYRENWADRAEDYLNSV